MNDSCQEREAGGRAAALRRYAVLDTPPEAALDDLTRLAGQICQVPIALISLLDEERVWFKARTGSMATEVSLDHSFCLEAARYTEVFTVSDAAMDVRFAASPLVTGAAGIRFYAGAPLVTPDEVTIGTLCVMDLVPRELRTEQVEMLAVLGRQAMLQLELGRKERELQASTRKLQAIVHAVPACVKLIGQDAVLYEMNEAGLEIVGAKRLEEVLGSHLLKLVVPESREQMQMAVAAAAGGEASWQTFQIRSLKGDLRWLEMYLAPFRDEIRGADLVLAVSADITERRKRETELRETTQRLANAQRITKIGSWDLDLVKGELAWSDQVYEIFGAAKETFAPTYEAFLGLVHPEDREEVDRVHSAAFRGEGALDVEHRMVLPDGSEKRVHSLGEVECDAGGKAVRASGTVQDITERKLLEQSALRAQRMDSVGTLAGGIAHDLNNALAPILMGVDLLEKRFPDPASRALIGIIGSSAQRGADMVRQVLAFTRGVEGRRVEVNVHHAMAEVETMVRETFPENIRVFTDFPPDLWALTGDPTQLHQVLINLCLNARDAMPEGGELRLSAENLRIDQSYASMLAQARPGPYVLIAVEDTGTGMPASIVEKIFDPFFTTKEVGKGTGLGLASALAIVRSHGGFLHPHSEVGKGTRFRIYLPAHGIPAIAAERRECAELPRGRGEIILLVDDEEAVHEITAQTLQAFGYMVVTACDGLEAVAAYTDRRPAISAVLTDMMMPVMDGPEMIRILRKMDPALPIIAASGFIPPEEFAEMGVRHFLAKPYTAEALLKMLREILRPPA